MSARGWFERLLDTVADHGRDLIGLRDPDERDAPSNAELCHRLVDGVGEASNIALAREILQRWTGMDEVGRREFVNLLAVEFDPDPDAIVRAAGAYRARDPERLRELLEATEPPRQELFRRLNMAPGGTKVLVDMRSFLLGELREHPEFRNVDADLQHLLGSWFNRGFLRLERIDWNSPAEILEQLIRYEAVHPMRGWDDLRRRLAADRRCFAFFHPALAQTPLIFVEVALTRGVSASIAPLIDPQAPIADPAIADTAVFYSINNALTGLRGVSFGNFLIKQVVTELGAEFPDIDTFVTLSPVPRMRSALGELLGQDSATADELRLLLARHQAALREASACDQPLAALDRLLERDLPRELTGFVGAVLRELALFYLLRMKRRAHAVDPVANFHLSNGARLERINTVANPSERGRRESWGCMVNYRYDGATVVENHEAYVGEGKIALSKELDRLNRQLASVLTREASEVH
ncbi:MAG: malonyl-CoA decarboxylase family protein [Chromatiales bacterium]|nr:malonyl-CoA decarboxylase family protein [Chromatiales bacterium]